MVYTRYSSNFYFQYSIIYVVGTAIRRYISGTLSTTNVYNGCSNAILLSDGNILAFTQGATGQLEYSYLMGLTFDAKYVITEATSSISGLLISDATTTTSGQVYVL